MPTSASGSLATGGRDSVSLDRLETTYGLISMLREPEGASMPTTAEASDAWNSARMPDARGARVRNDTSFFARFRRRALKPQICARPGRYRSDLNGIAISTVQPLSN